MLDDDSDPFGSENSNDWVDDDLDFTENEFPSFDSSERKSKSPEELFELFFDNDVINLILQESSKYAQFRGKPDPKISVEELKVFLGILIVSGYNKRPGVSYFWDSGTDMRNNIIYKSMRRDRFKLIMSSIHFASNANIDPNDKMFKLRPLMNLLQRNFIKNFIPKQHLDYDESMIRYFGRHSCKQYIRGKPIRFGYKVWSLNSSDGYLINFEVYQGNGPKTNCAYEQQFGKCTAPLAVMVDEIPDEHKKLPFRFYLDNLFTGMNILNHLKKLNYSATGTMRENRIPISCPLRAESKAVKNKLEKVKQGRVVKGSKKGLSSKKPVNVDVKQVMKKGMKNLKRGTFESVKCKQQNIIITKWVDNNVVTMASTIHGVNPLSSVSRYSKSEQKKVQIPQPNMFTEYNKHMGGTDRMNQNIGAYRISVRGKKWYWPIFTWLIDVCIQNAWIMLKEHKKITQLEFRRQLATTYLTRHGVPPLSAGRKPRIENQLHDLLRFDGIDHWIVKTESRRRCSFKCGSRVATECLKCEVGLCIDCFLKYHKK